MATDSRRPTGAVPGDSGETFLRRWSRRKQAADATQGGGAEPADVAESTAADASLANETRPPLTDADMPDLDALDADASYADFLSSGVSEALRRRALRKLFHSPAYNVCDGLDDYAEDFTKFEKLGDIVTADMKHRLEMDAEKRRLAALDDAPDESPSADAVAVEHDFAAADEGLPETAEERAEETAEETAEDETREHDPAEEPDERTG